MKILFLIPYPLQEAPSQRFRFEQYFGTLTEMGIKYTIQSFLNSQNWQSFYKSGKIFTKLLALTLGFVKRWGVLFLVPSYDYVFIHREAAPLGPPVFEWIIARLLRKKIIYDFDDAIWLTDRKTESALFQFIKFRRKVRLICSWSHKVSCGNAYLADYAKRFNLNVLVNPTTIDTDNLHNPGRYRDRINHLKQDPTVIIGWTGSHSTLKYLNEIEGVLQRIQSTHTNVHVCVIADKKPQLTLQRLQFKPWSVETEISDLATFDIGIMPLLDDEWAKGKCGFKALQYMAMTIPTIASPVGVNTTIIQHGINGFLASTPDEWYDFLKALIENKELRAQIGTEASQQVSKNYSISSNKNLFVSLFN